ncbi:MAG TPA: glycerophosphoryl diester phosphodiesterase membrane domain-containing protein [Ornithinimicrobium sp.]|uniref:glycerophosphoryl diester phosphodiesterase membrane domain-containing protein n=1 Tax=Ornithinimicrobium sp. TaxID=1977084 RepID=UPI002B490DCB|nr:glycerophosphoryl diester phosphodiesterase membrane domain-containing protein [Ornithinimicrobium sp.]HKJ12641.1 glycerophosphoryl diester phosphodiesterase membrane domain-containing protein [Ornithinimicrobium sp.]
MYQPGVVPLRPLSLGDIFGGAVNTIRRNPEATMGMAVVVLAAFLLPSLVLSYGVQLVPGIGGELAGFIGVLIPSLVAAVATVLLTGFVLYVVSEAALGDKVGLGQTWTQVRARLLPLIAGTLLTSVLVSAPLVAGAGALIAAIAVGETAVVVIAVLAFIVSFVAMLWLAVRLILTPAPIVLERVGPLRGITRSWALSRGRQFWRLLGITVLAQLLAGIVGSVVSTPLQALISFGGATIFTDESSLLTVMVFGQHLAQFAVGVVVTPFTAGVTALLYLDQRMRREGLDIAMQQAASTRTARRHRR